MCVASAYQYKPLYDDQSLPPQPDAAAAAAATAPSRQLPIRLLRLLRGQFDDDIRLELEDAWIDEIEAQGKDGTFFEALSYVWGSRDNPATVWIRDKTLSVTANLATALRHLRYANEDSMFWIDAICIDQSNKLERSKQVALMRDIFRTARRVVFWLGPEEGQSDYAIELIDDFSEKVLYVPASDTFKPAGKTGDRARWFSPEKPVFYGTRELNALTHFVMRPWFERLWIHQEIYFGHKSGIIMCGTRYFSWWRFENWTSCLLIPTWDPDLKERWRQISPQGRRRLCHINRMIFGENSLNTLRHDFSCSKCEDPRDRIYAVLSMCPQREQQLGISANYTLSTKDVYKDAVTRYLQGLKDANILSECELKPTFEGPSWVPDWSSGLFSTSSKSILSFRASGPISSCVTVRDEILTAAVVVIDTIQHVVSVGPRSYAERAERAIRGAIPQQAATTDYAAGDGSLLEAYVRAMGWEDTTERYTPFPDFSFGDFEAFTHLIHLVHQGTPFEEAILLRKEGSCGIRSPEPLATGTHAPFTTQKGYVGMGPETAQLGDVVCVVLGCQWPLVLRPTTPGAPKHVIVGDCYVSGFMHGEALLGKIPPPFKTVVDPTIYGGAHIRQKLLYLNTETGATQIEDPRLGALGIDLEPYRKEWELDNPELVDVPTELLREKGVDVRLLDIV
jgi:hypothetical protein